MTVRSKFFTVPRSQRFPGLPGMDQIRQKRSTAAAGDITQKFSPYFDVGSLVPNYINGVPSYSGQIQLYLQCNGVNGSHTFPDLSANKHSATVVNNAQVSTAIKKFGSGSLYCPAATDYLSIPAHSAFNFGANQFSIQFQIYITTLGAGGYLFSQLNASTSAEMSIFVDETPKVLHFINWDGSTWAIWIDCPWTPTENTWYHIEVDRIGSDWFIFINGIAQTLTKDQGAWANALYAINAPLFINNSLGTNGIIGYYDEVRVDNIALHTSNFTPPIGEVEP